MRRTARTGVQQRGFLAVAAIALALGVAVGWAGSAASLARRPEFAEALRGRMVEVRGELPERRDPALLRERYHALRTRRQKIEQGLPVRLSPRTDRVLDRVPDDAALRVPGRMDRGEQNPDGVVREAATSPHRSR